MTITETEERKNSIVETKFFAITSSLLTAGIIGLVVLYGQVQVHENALSRLEVQQRMQSSFVGKASTDIEVIKNDVRQISKAVEEMDRKIDRIDRASSRDERSERNKEKSNQRRR